MNRHANDRCSPGPGAGANRRRPVWRTVAAVLLASGAGEAAADLNFDPVKSANVIVSTTTEPDGDTVHRVRQTDTVGIIHLTGLDLGRAERLEIDFDTPGCIDDQGRDRITHIVSITSSRTAYTRGRIATPCRLVISAPAGRGLYNHGEIEAASVLLTTGLVATSELLGSQGTLLVDEPPPSWPFGRPLTNAGTIRTHGIHGEDAYVALVGPYVLHRRYGMIEPSAFGNVTMVAATTAYVYRRSGYVTVGDPVDYSPFRRGDLPHPHVLVRGRINVWHGGNLRLRASLGTSSRAKFDNASAPVTALERAITYVYHYADRPRRHGCIEVISDGLAVFDDYTYLASVGDEACGVHVDADAIELGLERTTRFHAVGRNDGGDIAIGVPVIPVDPRAKRVSIGPHFETDTTGRNGSDGVVDIDADLIEYL